MGLTTVLELDTKLGCVLSPDGTAESIHFFMSSWPKAGNRDPESAHTRGPGQVIRALLNTTTLLFWWLSHVLLT